MKHVKLSISQERAAVLAKKYRRPRTWWETSGAIRGGDPGFGGGLAALWQMLFPITCPLYLLFCRPQKLDWIKLSYWPFYDVTVGLSVGSGIRKIHIWVEGTDQGLMGGLNIFGKGIWNHRVVGGAEPIDHPLAVDPKNHLGVCPSNN